MPDPYDALAAVEAQIADREQKLKAREGKREYVENVKALRAEIARLKMVRDTIHAGRLASGNSEETIIPDTER